VGFHRFDGPFATGASASENKAAALAAVLGAQSQVTSSELAAYVSEMGVDAWLVGVASAASYADMAFPNVPELRALGVTFDDEARWTLQLGVKDEVLVLALWLPFYYPRQIAFACTRGADARRCRRRSSPRPRRPRRRRRFPRRRRTCPIRGCSRGSLSRRYGGPVLRTDGR